MFSGIFTVSMRIHTKSLRRMIGWGMVVVYSLLSIGMPTPDAESGWFPFRLTSVKRACRCSLELKQSGKCCCQIARTTKLASANRAVVVAVQTKPLKKACCTAKQRASQEVAQTQGTATELETAIDYCVLRSIPCDGSSDQKVIELTQPRLVESDRCVLSEGASSPLWLSWLSACGRGNERPPWDPPRSSFPC